MAFWVKLLAASVCGYALGCIQLTPFLLKRGKYRHSPRAAAVAMVVDVAKGAVAIPLLILLIGRNSGLAVLIPVLFVIIGHRFPLPFRFRGGKGAAPAVGVLTFVVPYGLIAGIFTLESAVIALVAGTALFISTRRIEIVGLVVVAFLIINALIDSYWVLETIGAGIAGIIVIGVSVEKIAGLRLLSFPDNADVKVWRIAARPFALLFVAIDVIWDRRIVLVVIGVLALIFIVTDLVRLFSKAEIGAIFKRKEAKRFSSMTLFLVATFLTFLLFPDGISYIALACITVGDFFSKLLGMRYGRRLLYRKKTLEGSLGFLAGSLTASYCIAVLVDVPILFVLIGAGVATIVELFSERIDDNFTVSIVTGGFLTAIRFFTGV